MFNCRNDKGVHGQRKVGSPCFVAYLLNAINVVRHHTIQTWVRNRAVEPELKFRAQAPTSNKVSGSGPDSITIWSNKNKKILFYLYNWLAQQIMSVEPKPEFQAPAALSEIFWLRFQPPKIAWASAPQPWLESVHCSSYTGDGQEYSYVYMNKYTWPSPMFS